MDLLTYIIWNADPTIFTIPLSKLGMEDRPIVWYGLLFASGFIISQQVLYYIFRTDGQNEKDVDTLTTYMVLATILGARLGHCLFYNPQYYLSNPVEILKIWEGGLASHGGALGIFIALWIYANYEIKSKWVLIIPKQFNIRKRKKEGQSYFWILDRMAIVVLLTGALIRTGNLMNSEMEGTLTNSDYGLIYARGATDILNYSDLKIEEVTYRKGGPFESPEPGKYPITAIIKYKRTVEVDETEQAFIQSRVKRNLFSYSEVDEHIDFGSANDPLSMKVVKEGGYNYVEIYGMGKVRHPGSVYEALACLIMMVIVFWLWKTKRHELPEGFMFGLFMTMLWSQRFFTEFFKMDQEVWEADIPLNMGQWLSIPLFFAGVAVMIYAFRAKKSPVG